MSTTPTFVPSLPGAGMPRPAEVMLLRLWRDPGRSWHARIVDCEAGVHDFDSPFELARYLCAPGPTPPAAAAPPAPGLR